MHLSHPIRVPRISNRVPRIRENYHRVPKIRENRVPRIREIGSLQIQTGFLTFSLKKTGIEHDRTQSNKSVLYRAHLFENSIKLHQQLQYGFMALAVQRRKFFLCIFGLDKEKGCLCGGKGSGEQQVWEEIIERSGSVCAERRYSTRTPQTILIHWNSSSFHK